MLVPSSPGAMAHKTSAEWWWLPLAAAGIISGVALVQWIAYRDAMREERASLAALQQHLTALRVIAGKLDEFDRESRLLDEKRAVVRRLLPATLDIKGYVARLRTVASIFGFTISAATARESTEGRVQKATIDLALEGNPAGLGALGRRIDAMVPIATWTVVESNGRQTRARAEIYALPDRPADRPLGWCSPEKSRVWLWPFTSRLEKARRAWEAPCREFERLKPVRGPVDEFERQRLEFQEIVDVAERLRAGHAPDKVIPPDAWTTPSPEASPHPELR
jgi:hypothetical protein